VFTYARLALCERGAFGKNLDPEKLDSGYVFGMTAVWELSL